MLRQLPPTITADATPDWLPVGWIVHSTVLKRGRQTRTYTQLRTGKKFSTKDQVLEYIKMEKIREERVSGIERKKASLKAFQDRETASERPSQLSDDWRTGSVGGNPYKMYVNTSKERVVLYQNTMESESSSGEEDETGCNEISYVIEEDEEDFSESEYVEDKETREDVENFSNIISTSLRSQPERMQKLESRAKTQCVFEDEDMSSDSDNKLLPEGETSKEENALGEARVVSNLVESFEEKNLHDVVIECDDKARKIPGLTGSFTVEINLDSEPASDSLVEKNWNKSGTEGIGTRNIEIIDLESDLMHISASSKVVEVTQESGGKREEPLKAQAAQEETSNESRRSVFFPYREAPSHSVLVFDNSNARSSAEALSNTIELGLNPQEKNISGSEMRKNMKECSSKNFKKKDTEAPTKKLQKGKTPTSIRQGKKGSSSVVKEKKSDDWPEPCPNFPFELLTKSFQVEDDSVIRRYLEQHFTAPWVSDSNLPLPDFGLPSFYNIRISLNEEPESKRKKSPDPPCVHVASSSLPSCSSIGTTMQHTVAGT